MVCRLDLKLCSASGNRSDIKPVLPATPIHGHRVLLKDEPKNYPLLVLPHSVHSNNLTRVCLLGFPSDFQPFNNREVTVLEEGLDEDFTEEQGARAGVERSGGRSRGGSRPENCPLSGEKSCWRCCFPRTFSLTLRGKCSEDFDSASIPKI